MSKTEPQAPASTPNEQKGQNRLAIGLIIGISLLAVLLLVYLIYIKPPAASDDTLPFLPALNAALNALSATFICIGLWMIKRGRTTTHQRMMLAAFASSTAFLVSYMLHKHLHGDTPFPTDVSWRYAYWAILASHIILSIVALPLILTTFYASLSGRLAFHRKIAKVTAPIWLYVSVTGVLVFVLLKVAGA